MIKLFHGDNCEVVTPVPIPNTEVKHLDAENSSLSENRTLPVKPDKS